MTNVTTVLKDVETTFLFVEPLWLRAIFVLGLFVCLSFVVWIITKSLLHRLYKKKISAKALNRMELPFTIIILLTGIYLSGRIVGLDDILGIVYLRIYLTLLSIGFTVFTYQLLRAFSWVLRHTIQQKGVNVVDEKLTPVLRILVQVGLTIALLLTLFEVWGISLTPILASAGLAGVIVALAAKDTFANLFGGLSMFLDKSFQIGDIIVIDNQERGIVEDISLRSTKIRTRDEVMVTIPNAIMASSKIVNESGMNPYLRVRIDINVPYGANIDKAEKVVMKTAQKADYILKDPAPFVRVREFGSYSIQLQLMFYIDEPFRRGYFKSLMLKDIYTAFNKAKIKFPYPTQDINVKNGH